MWEFVTDLGKCICKQPAFKMNEYNILRNVLKVRVIIPKEDDVECFEKEFPKNYLVKPADSTRRAGQRPMEESAAHHVNNSKLSFTLKSERAPGLTDSFFMIFDQV